jgi:flagellar L-ring protein precursor FlgH
MLRINAIASLSLLITACNIQPSSIVPYPTSTQPERVNIKHQNGAIFQAQTYKPMFENYRARAVGDVITIVISEKISADKANSTSDNKSSSIDAKLTSLFGLGVSGMQAAEKSNLQSKGNMAGSASYNFAGTIAATVLEVRPNGELVVSGEKRVGMDKGTEFIRISGVVVPIMMDQGNSILSTKLADARVEYRTNSQIDEAEILKSFGRFFSTFLLL